MPRQAGGDGPLSAARRRHRRAARRLIDGQRLTQWRTACASALAASYLAREDASRLLVIGAGALSPVPGQGAFGGAADQGTSASGTARSANAEKVAAGLARRRP